MPASSLKTMADKSPKTLTTLERYWDEAKASFDDLPNKGDIDNKWAYILGIVKKRAGVKESLLDDLDGEMINEFLEMKKLTEDGQPWSAFNDSIPGTEPDVGGGSGCVTCGGSGDLPGKAEYSGTKVWPESCPNCDGHQTYDEGVQTAGGYDSDHDVRTTAQIAARHKDKGNDDHADRGASIIAKRKDISKDAAHEEIDKHRGGAKKTSTAGGGPSFGGDEKEEIMRLAREILLEGSYPDDNPDDPKNTLERPCEECLDSQGTRGAEECHVCRGSGIERLKEDEMAPRKGSEVYKDMVKARQDTADTIKSNRKFAQDKGISKNPITGRGGLNRFTRQFPKNAGSSTMKPTPANLKAAAKDSEAYSKGPLWGSGSNPHSTETYSACGADDAECERKELAGTAAQEYKSAYKYTRNVLGMKEDMRGKGVVFETRELQPLEEELLLLNEDADTMSRHNIGDVIGHFKTALGGNDPQREIKGKELQMLNTFGKHLTKGADSGGTVDTKSIKNAYKTALSSFRDQHVSKDPMDYHGRGLVKKGGETYQTDRFGDISKKIVGGRPVDIEENKEPRIREHETGFSDMMSMMDAIQLTEGSDFVKKASDLILQGFNGDGAALLAALDLTYPDAQAHGEALRMAEYMITQLTAAI